MVPMHQFASAITLAVLLQVVPGAAYAQTPTRLTASPTAVDRVVAAGLMSNYSDGSFRPDNLVSRAELASILVKTFQLNQRLPSQQAPEAVRDVPTSHWAYRDIQTVLKTKTMQGYRDGLFYPNQKVTRAEAWAIFGQAYGVFQLPDETVNRILAAYPDAKQAPAWSHKALATVLNERFVNADAQMRIYPLNPVTRGDLAYTLSQYLERQQEGPTPERVEDIVDPRPMVMPSP